MHLVMIFRRLRFFDREQIIPHQSSFPPVFFGNVVFEVDDIRLELRICAFPKEQIETLACSVVTHQFFFFWR